MVRALNAGPRRLDADGTRTRHASWDNPVGPRALLGLSIAALTSPLYAQESNTPTAAGPAVGQEVVIVTANKREESLQDVAQTVNVVTGDFLEDLQIRSFKDLQTTVAGLQLSRVSNGEQSASMRGIKMENPGGAGSATNTVEMYVNEVPISAIDSFNSLFDIGQVEILRGPQGTLRGRPSPSGAITIAPRRGSYDESDAYIQLGGSNNGGASLQAAWGGPLAETVSLRIAGIHDENDGNGFRSLGNGQHSYQEELGLRATLGWAPTDRFELLVMQQHNDQEQDFYRGIAGTETLPNSPWFGQTFTFEDRIALNQANPSTYEADLTTITARYDFENYAFNYVGGYKDAAFTYVLDFDFAGVGAALGSFPQNAYLWIANDSEVQTNEFRFESTGGEFYNFTVGIFTSTSDFETEFAFTTVRPLDPSVVTPNAYSLEDTGIFMNHTFDLGDKTRFSVGVRRSEYDVKRLGNGPDVDFSATTGNASVQYDFSADVMGYVSFGKSFRPGTGGANVPGQPVPASFANNTDEESTSTEIGVKAQFLDGRATLNVAYYDQQYDGFIAQTNQVACTGVPNPNGLAFATVDGTATGDPCFLNPRFNGDAVAEGIDLELRASVTENVTVGLNYAYVDAHFENALVPCNDYNGDGTIDNMGAARVQQGAFVSVCSTNDPLGQLAPNSLSANTSYHFDIGAMAAFIRANVNYHDEEFFPQTARDLPADTRVDAYLGLTTSDRSWEFTLWAKNLFDKVVQDNDGGNADPFGATSGLFLGTATLDRELGLTVRRDF